MVKAVLTTKVEPTYDDLPEERYHFPRTYLRAVERAVGDWIVYYEPSRPSGDRASRGGRMAYFAMARVESIVEDRTRPDHFYALISHYLEFDTAISFRDGLHYYEGALRRADGKTNKGAFGRAVRNLPDHEYDLIIQAGFAEIGFGHAEASPTLAFTGLSEEQTPFARPMLETVVRRPFRDQAFAKQVKAAYDNTCAITGLKLINGGGRAEVEAAHIRPVASEGPDSLRNGLALSQTVHWMFDRGLLTIDDDYRILTAEKHVPETVQRLINPDGQLRLPNRPEILPHPRFLEFHRENVFKG